jgi:hypothetical protein
LVNIQYVQHDIASPVWIYSDSRDLFKSIQNVTIDDNKVVTIDMLENWKKNMTDWMTELFERKLSSLFFPQNCVTVLKAVS